jgi:hypothetical protein
LIRAIAVARSTPCASMYDATASAPSRPAKATRSAGDIAASRSARRRASSAAIVLRMDSSIRIAGISCAAHVGASARWQPFADTYVSAP